MSSLLWSLIRNIGASELNRDKIGYRIEKQFEAIDHDEALAYARAVKDNYLHDGGYVPPFYPSKLLAPMAKELISLKGLNLNLLKMVHGEQAVRWHHPIKVGDRLKFILAIENISATQAGDLLILLGKGFKQDRLMVETRMGFLVRKKTSTPKKKREAKAATALFRYPFQTDDGQQLAYAKASGDSNFIHTNSLLARMAGLPRTIMQGLCVMAMTCSTLSEKLIHSDPCRLVSIKGRFAQIVLPGQRLEVVGYEGDHPSEVRFDVLNPTGKKVIKRGVYAFRMR